MTTRRRIIHLSSVHPPFDARIFHKECKSLARAGYEVSLVVPHTKEETVDGIHVIPVPRKGSKLSRMIKTNFLVYHQALKRHADLYHFHDPELIPYGLLLKKKGYRVIYDVHENVPMTILTKEYLPKPIRKIISYALDKFEIWASRRFDHIVTVLPEIAERFDTVDTAVVKNYPELQPEKINRKGLSKESEPAVVYIGGITEIRGAVEMVEAINIVAQKRKAKLILGGNISPTELLNKLKKLNGWNYTDYRGWVDRDTLKEILSTSRIGLAVLKPTPNYSGGLATKLLEYLIFGIPVVASDFPLYEEIIRAANCGITVDPNDINQISDAIQWLLDHPEKALEMGNRGRDYILKNMTWSQEEDKLLRVYESVLKDKIELESNKI